MTKARFTIYDPKLTQYQEVIDALNLALKKCEHPDFDGGILILTRRDKKKPVILRAGKLKVPAHALMQLTKLKLHLTVDSDDE